MPGFADSLRNVLQGHLAILQTLTGGADATQVQSLIASTQGQIQALEALPQTSDIESRIAMLESQVAALQKS